VKASADISDVYVSVSCDAGAGVARITISREDEGYVPPRGMKLLQFLHGHNKPNDPVKVCSIGEKREIALLGDVDSDHPRNDALWIFVGTSRAPSLIPVANILRDYHVTARRMSKEYYVSIEECDDKGECHGEVRTDPSFDCRKGDSIVERLICEYLPLAKLDLELDRNFRNVLHTSKEPGETMKEQLKWLQSRGPSCDIPKPLTGSGSTRAIAAPFQRTSGYLPWEHCLEKYYKDRLAAIKGMP